MTSTYPDSHAGPLRVLWVMEHAGFVRYFESAIRELGRRQHRVDIAFETGRNKLSERRTASETLQDVENVRLVALPAPPLLRMEAIAYRFRMVRDSLRYSHRDYRQAPLLRDRADRFLPPMVRQVVAVIRRVPGVRGIADRACALVERAVAPRRDVRDMLTESRPDVVMVTPGINFESTQPEFLKAAALAAIPTVAAIPSWDNLTTKGHLKWVPDRVLVWNDAMRREAAAYHDVPGDRVAVVGAAAFDPLFAWTPSRSAEEFKRMVGLPVDRPFVLYLGSSSFLAPREVEFVESWIRAIRGSSDPSVARLAILIRPHPTNLQPWNSAEVEGYGDVAVWPRRAHHPGDPDVRRHFYDSLYHSVAAIGANTSAQIEAAIVGRPVLSVQAEDLERSQRQVLHFGHLAGGQAPLLVISRSFDEHLEQLRRVVHGDTWFRPQLERFVQTFVRPHGPAVLAASRIADEVERLAAQPRRAPASLPTYAPVVRAAVLVPGSMMVALARMSGKPAWAIALRIAFRTVMVVATPFWKLPRLRKRLLRAARDLRGTTLKALKRTTRRLS